MVLRLKKPLYGLDDASRKFWRRVKEVFAKIGMNVMEGDESFYYLHDKGFLKGAVITHVDDFTVAGTSSFIEEVLDIVERELTISKIKRDNFRFTGLDVSTKEDGIEIKMADYMASIPDVIQIRKADKERDLTKQEIKEYR